MERTPVDTTTTIALLKDRLNENPADVQAAVALGNAYFDKQDAPQAIMYYLVALNINPDQPGVRTDMGTMLWRNENISLAEQAFRKVIQDSPDFGNAYVNLGYLLQYARNDLAQARKVWQSLVDKYPEQPAAVKAREILAGS